MILWLFLLFLAAPSWAQEKDWETQWDELLLNAKKEGKVVVMGSADPVIRKLLPTTFKSRFGISLEYIGGRGADNFAKLNMERRAGVFTIDAVMAGSSNMAAYHREKLLEPLLPALILPEVLDPSLWKKGKLWFIDPEERYILRIYNYVTSGGIAINTDHVKPGDFASIRNLLSPQWKGKFSVFDPTVSGEGDIQAARFFLEFGEEVVRQLYVDQKPGITRDKRQLADWLARGTYPVSLDAATELVVQLKKVGLPVDNLSVPDAPGSLGVGNGLVALIHKAPHPHAARVFVNWIASKEGVELLGRARLKPTTRSDVDESYAAPWEVPQPGIKYFDPHTWEFVTVQRPRIGQRIRDLLKSR